MEFIACGALLVYECQRMRRYEWSVELFENNLNLEDIVGVCDGYVISSSMVKIP